MRGLQSDQSDTSCTELLSKHRLVIGRNDELASHKRVAQLSNLVDSLGACFMIEQSVGTRSMLLELLLNPAHDQL